MPTVSPAETGSRVLKVVVALAAAVPVSLDATTSKSLPLTRCRTLSSTCISKDAWNFHWVITPAVAATYVVPAGGEDWT
jgi:hypothetical protein